MKIGWYSAAPSARTHRPNPGFVFVRGGSQLYPEDHLLPVPYGSLRKAIFETARRSRGERPIPFIWVGLTYFIIAEPEFYLRDELLRMAVEEIPELPASLLHQVERGEVLEGYIVATPAGTIRELVIRDFHGGQWEKETHIPPAIALLKALRWEGVLLPETKMTWSYEVPGRQAFGTLPGRTRRTLDLGTAQRVMG